MAAGPLFLSPQKMLLSSDNKQKLDSGYAIINVQQ